MPDRPARHELAEADRPAEGGEARAAMGTGLTGPVQILGPEHVVGRRRLTGTSGEGLGLDERVTVRGEERGRSIRRVAIFRALVAPRDHEVGWHWSVEQRAPLGAAPVA